MNRRLRQVWIGLAACALGALAVLAVASCVPPAPALQPRTVTVTVTDGTQPVVAARVVLDASDPTGTHDAGTDANGVARLALVPPRWANAQLTVTAGGCDAYGQSVVLPIGKDAALAVTLHCPPPPPEHFDPSNIQLEQIAAVRGAMWPSASRCPQELRLPYGPRPGQPDNIIATDFWANYSASDQQAILRCLAALGYTHVVMGPIVDSDGYHGQYAPHDWHWEDAAHLTGDNWQRFLDIAQQFWDGINGHHFVPVIFLHPDGWSLDQTKAVITPLLQDPRAQQLLRFVVPHGWEPCKYECSSYTWAEYGKWAREQLPNAVVALHTVADVDAPVGTDALGDDNGHPNGEGWARVAPFYHVWLIQNGAYNGSPADLPQTAREFAAQFQADGDGATFHSIGWHFYGAGGWTRDSAWGSGLPIKLVAAEHTAYEGYWNNLAEAKRVQWGDLCAAQPLCAGYLDGGTVPVPVRP